MKRSRRMTGKVITVAFLLLSGCAHDGFQERVSALEARSPLSVSEQRRAGAMAHYTQGILNEINDDFEAALAHYRQALELDPENEDLYFRVAMGLFQLRKPEESIKILETLLDRFPKSSRGFRWMALTLRAMERDAEAVAVYNRWIKALPKESMAYIQKADYLLRAGKLDEAGDLLDDALSDTGRTPQILRGMADVLFAKGVTSAEDEESTSRRKAALTLMEEIRVLQPDDLALLERLAETYVLDRQSAKALDVYEVMRKKKPVDTRTQERMVRGYLTLGEQEKALDLLKEIVGKDGSDPEPHRAMADIYLQLEDVPRASQAYLKAIKADPKAPQAYIQYCLLNLERDPESCVEILQKGLQALPDHLALMEMLAYVYMVGAKDYALAVEQFRKVISRSGGKSLELEPSFFFNYTFALQRSGDIAGAADQLDLLFEENPDFVEVYARGVMLDPGEDAAGPALNVLANLGVRYPDEPRFPYYQGMLLNYKRDYAAAIQAFDACAALVEKTGEGTHLLGKLFSFWYGAALERQGRYEEAEGWLEKSIAADPEFADALNYLAYMWAERGEKLDRAHEYISRALVLEPGNGAYHDTLGWIHFMRGEHSDALVSILRALESMPNDPTILDHLGDVFHALGDSEKAAEAWKKSLVADDQNEKVRGKLESLGLPIQQEPHKP